MIASFAYIIVSDSLGFLVTNDIAIVTVPILPIYISAIIILWQNKFILLNAPLLKPTVAIAETDSNNKSSELILVFAINNKLDTIKIAIVIDTTAIAFANVSCGIVLLKILICFFK